MVSAVSLQEWANIAQIVGAVGLLLAVAGLWIAWRQLDKARKATRGQMILAIDEALSRYDDIRDEARDPAWNPPPRNANDDESKKKRRRVHQYMGVFERIEHLLSDASIDLETVNEFYGRRAEYLLRSEGVQEYVTSKPDEWTTLAAFSRRLHKKRSALPGF